jgi:site-specific DNA-methyltransferase (adenine-specific)
MNQKPLKLLERVILASSDLGDIIWEPFGGLCSTAVACLATGRHCFSAEINGDYFPVAAARLKDERQTSACDRPRLAAIA